MGSTDASGLGQWAQAEMGRRAIVHAPSCSAVWLLFAVNINPISTSCTGNGSRIHNFFLAISSRKRAKGTSGAYGTPGLHQRRHHCLCSSHSLNYN